MSIIDEIVSLRMKVANEYGEPPDFIVVPVQCVDALEQDFQAIAVGVVVPIDPNVMHLT